MIYRLSRVFYSDEQGQLGFPIDQYTLIAYRDRGD